MRQSIMTHNIMTLSIMITSITMLSITALDMKIVRITKCSEETLKETIYLMTLSITIH